MNSLLARLSRVLSLLCMAALALGALPAWSQEFPSKPIRIINFNNPGNPGDQIVRQMGAKLNERLGWQTIHDYKIGGDFVPALLALTQSPADGYSVLIGVMSLTVLPATKKDYPVDLQKELMPLLRFARTPLVLAINASIPANNLAELVAYSKANPGKLNWPGVLSGSLAHLTAEMLKQTLGIDAVYVPHTTGAAVTLDVVSGRGHISAAVMSEFGQHIAAGKLRPLAWIGSNAALPQVPTLMALTGNPELDLSSWYGLFLRAGTPRPIAERLERELILAAQTPETKAVVQKVGLEPVVEGSDAFRKGVEADLRRWDRVVKQANLKFD